MSEILYTAPAVISYCIGLLAFLAFSIHLGLGWRGGFRASVLLASTVISALWSAAAASFAFTNAPVIWTGYAVLDATRVGAWLLFMGLLLAGRPLLAPGLTTSGKGMPASRERRSLFRFIGWVAAFLALPAIALFFPISPPPINVAAIVPSRLPFGLLLGVSITGLVFAEQLFRRAGEQVRWSIKPLCLGLGGGFFFDLYMYADALLFGYLNPDIWAARGIAQALVIPFIALATVRNREWTIDIALSRGVVFHSTAFFVSGIYLLGVAAAGYYVRYFGGNWGQTFQVSFIFAATLLLVWLFSSGTLRSKLKVLINKNFFSYRYDYREEWLRFTNLLSTDDPTVSVQQRCIQALANVVESPGGMLWLRNEGETCTLAARWNMPPVSSMENDDRALLQFLQATGWVINLEEFRIHPSRYPDLRLPGWLNDIASAWLIVPIHTRDGLGGFMILATPRARIDVNWEVLDLLKTAARQIGSFLGQIRASEALLEARKFDAFNKMTAFVVHDLKNLVAQLSLLLKNAERHRMNPQFQEDMLSTVAHVTERMNKLLYQLSTGNRSEESVRPVNLGKLVKRVIDAKINERADINFETSANVVTLGYEQRFERVIGHLVQNAIDATTELGAVTVCVFAEQETAFLEITDTGCGMSEEFAREKLFRAFQTTKQHGMGIGAYETAQYVKEIGGKILVASAPAAGTRIRISFPLYRDNQPAEHLNSEVA